MAVTIETRLTRIDETRMTARVNRRPRQKATTSDEGETDHSSLNRNSGPLNWRLMVDSNPVRKSIMPQETSRPRPRPRTQAARSYTSPSVTNICTMEPRRMPRALTMPSSDRRSAASIT